MEQFEDNNEELDTFEDFNFQEILKEDFKANLLVDVFENLSTREQERMAAFTRSSVQSILLTNKHKANEARLVLELEALLLAELAITRTIRVNHSFSDSEDGDKLEKMAESLALHYAIDFKPSKEFLDSLERFQGANVRRIKEICGICASDDENEHEDYTFKDNTSTIGLDRMTFESAKKPALSHVTKRLLIQLLIFSGAIPVLILWLAEEELLRQH